MKRRDLLKGGVAALAGSAAVVSAPAIAQNKIEITMVATWAETFPDSEPVHSDLPSVLPR